MKTGTNVQNSTLGENDELFHGENSASTSSLGVSTNFEIDAEIENLGWYLEA